MGFFEAIRTCLFQKPFTFAGRASRSEFWWFTLFYWLLMIVLVLVAMAGVGGFSYMQSVESVFDGLPTSLTVVAMIVLIALYIPVLAVTVRRFHDRDMSGWWVLVLIILNNVPFIGIAAVGAMIVIEIIKGTQGRNRFGDDPLTVSDSADVFA